MLTDGAVSLGELEAMPSWRVRTLLDAALEARVTVHRLLHDE